MQYLLMMEQKIILLLPFLVEKRNISFTMDDSKKN